MSYSSFKDSRIFKPVRGIIAEPKKLLNIYTAFALLVIIAAILSPAFFRPVNIFNVLRQASFLGIVSVGMTMVILSGNGGVDLSVGSTVSLSTCLAGGIMMGQPRNVPLAVLLCILMGAAVGMVNGLMVTKRNTNPFITTLGVMTVVQGIAMFYTKGTPIGSAPPGFRYIAEGYIGFVPVPVIFFLLLFAVGMIILSKSVFGRFLYAIGGNQEVSRLSGIKVDKYKILVYIISGVLASISGLFLVARVGLGDPKIGSGIELDSIAATIIGGTSFAGGVGGLAGTLVGVLIIAVMNNLLNLLNVSPFLHEIVKGLIVLTAISIQRKK